MAQASHEVVILSCPSMDGLAHQVVEQAVAKGWSWRTSDISWKFFPDETPNLFVNVDGIRGKDVVFLACFHNAHAIFAQLALICTCSRLAIGPLDFISRPAPPSRPACLWCRTTHAHTRHSPISSLDGSQTPFLRTWCARSPSCCRTSRPPPWSASTRRARSPRPRPWLVCCRRFRSPTPVRRV